MRRGFIMMMMIISCIAALAENLPVLRISFNGKTLTSTYVKGTMQLTESNGKVVELNAKFKTRGATASHYTMKPSFNMKLRDKNGNELDSALCGMRSLSSWILDAMAIDRINMRNRVAFDIWNEFSSLPYNTDFDSRNGTEGQFLEVYINDEYKGIYCMTDRINRKLLDLKKPDVPEVEGLPVTIRGVLYKHGTNDIADQNNVMFSEDFLAYVIAYHDAWELTEPEDYASPAAWEPLQDIYAHKNDYAWVKDHFYIQQLAQYQVFIMALSIADNWGNKNSYISARNVTADGNKHKFVYTPWDLDTSLGGSYNGNYYDGNYSNWTPADIEKASTKPVPFSLCGKQQDYKDTLRMEWLRGRNGALSVESVKAKLYRYRDLFINSGAWQRSCDYWNAQKYKPCYVSDLNKEIDYIVAWYEARVNALDQHFNITAEEIAGIHNTSTTDTPTPIYNLQGMQVKEPRKGIYIVGGRKVLYP